MCINQKAEEEAEGGGGNFSQMYPPAGPRIMHTCRNEEPLTI